MDTSNFLSREELFSRLNNINLRDLNREDKCEIIKGKLLVLLIFEGIKGVRFTDLLNLIVPDFDFENKEVFIESNNSYHKIKDNRTWDIIKEHINNRRFLKLNNTNEGVDDELVFLKETGGQGNPRGTMKKLYTTEMGINDINKLMSEIMGSINKKGLTGVPLYTNGLAERICKLLKEKDLNPTWSNVMNCMKKSEYRPGTRHLLENIRYLYY